jgi:hypothetical protein
MEARAFTFVLIEEETPLTANLEDVAAIKFIAMDRKS